MKVETSSLTRPLNFKQNIITEKHTSLVAAIMMTSFSLIRFIMSEITKAVSLPISETALSAVDIRADISTIT